MTLNHKIWGVALAALLAGCAQSPPSSGIATDVWIIQLPEQHVTSNHTPPDAKSFAPSTLYSLLVAEIAGHQGLPEVTLHHYLQESVKTRDLGIIKQTLEIAEYLNDDDSLLQAAILWTEVEPDNPRPFSIAFEELIQQNRFTAAQPLLQTMLQLGGLDGRYAIHSLIQRGNAMSPEERQRYLAFFKEQLRTAADNPYYLYATASLLANSGHLEEALAISQRAIARDPRYTRAVLLEAELQEQLGHLSTAVNHLSEYLVEIERRKYRNHKEFRLFYTRLLLKQQRFTEAEAQAEIVALKNRHDENILYYLGVLMLDYGRLDASEYYFNLLPDLTGLTGELHYYLGRIARLRGDQQQALKHFASVDDSRYLLSSLNEIGHILNGVEDQSILSQIFADVRSEHPYYAPLLYAIESHWLVQQEQSSAALPLLNEALELYPDDARLLFNRALLWSKLDNRFNMEKDLHKLLNMHPPTITGWSFSSYTPTDPVQRYMTVEGMMGKASTTKTEDPVILDGIGWVLHNSGDFEGALYYLKKAYAILPDPEIAAHLGTVYWKLGQPELAKKVWKTSLKQHPHYELLNQLSTITDDSL